MASAEADPTTDRAMAKDLGLDEHYEEHKAGRPCGSDLADCITKTRVWQTIFVCELMVGSPQGQSNPLILTHNLT